MAKGTMNMNINIDLTGNVLQPGDKVLLTLDDSTSEESCKEILATIKERFPDVEFSILLNGEAVVYREPDVATHYADNMPGLVTNDDMPNLGAQATPDPQDPYWDDMGKQHQRRD